ncbi:diaminopimelate epimerase [candidate division WOR-3 bacterium]|nr:diaminopimelate epimerase [candidate division WOR-3 bacterium]
MIFFKYQAAGNDYILIDLQGQNADGMVLDETARKFCERKKGIGADGLLVLKSYQECDFFLSIYNSDGSLAQMCGNGLRSAVLYFYKRIKRRNSLKVLTDSGVKNCNVIDFDGKNSALVKVSIAKPDFDFFERERFFPLMLNCPEKKLFYCVSVGNPHAVALVENAEKADLISLHDCVMEKKYFPDGINVSVVQTIDKNLFFQRVFERGAGETLSCGTGAAAAYAVLRKLGKIEKKTTARQKGGEIALSEEEDGEITIEGVVQEVFQGERDEI